MEIKVKSGEKVCYIDEERDEGRYERHLKTAISKQRIILQKEKMMMKMKGKESKGQNNRISARESKKRKKKRGERKSEEGRKEGRKEGRIENKREKNEGKERNLKKTDKIMKQEAKNNFVI